MFLARMKRTLLATAILSGSLCGVATAQTADTKVLSSQILPKDTYLYLTMPSVEGMKEAFANSSAGRLMADPAFDEIKTEIQTAFESEMDEGFAEVQETLGMTVEELMAIPTGEVALAFSKAPPNKMGAVIFFDYGAHESQVSTLLEKATTALQSVPQLKSADVEHDGTNIVMFSVTSEIAKKTPLAKEFGWFMKDERLVISNSGALLKLSLDNWEGAEQSLDSNPVYSYIMEQCESEDGSSLMTTYVDPIGLFTQLVQTGSLGEAGLPAGMAISVFPMLGANQMKAMGSVAEMGGEEGYEAVSRSFIYTEQPPQGAMQIFQLAAVDQVPPAWVKEDASAWMGMTWKVAEAYSAIETLVDMFQGAGSFERLIDQLAEQGPEIHIKKDVIDQLDGKINLVMSPGDPDAEGGTDDILISMGIRDNDKFAELLGKVASQPSFPAETRELEGATIYEINPGNGAKFAFTAVNGQLLIGIGGIQLEQAVRNDDDVRPLAESEDFKAVAEYFEEGALLVAFSRPAESYRRLYDMLRDGKAAENFPGSDEFFSRIDFSKLPPFEVVEKYMAPSGAYWIGDENGVYMEQFSLSAEEEEKPL